jgi:hypothetical protein
VHKTFQTVSLRTSVNKSMKKDRGALLGGSKHPLAGKRVASF